MWLSQVFKTHFVLILFDMKILTATLVVLFLTVKGMLFIYKPPPRYTVSMVNDGDGKHGSQFLITTADSLDVLDGVHTVFGHIAEGTYY